MKDLFQGLRPNEGWKAVLSGDGTAGYGIDVFLHRQGEPAAMIGLLCGLPRAMATALLPSADALCLMANTGKDCGMVLRLISQFERFVPPLLWKGFKHVDTTVIRPPAYCHRFNPVVDDGTKAVAWIENGDGGYIDRMTVEELDGYVVPAADDLFDPADL